MSCAAETPLERALRAAVAGFAGSVRVATLAETPWASVTFAGARHRLRLVIEGDGAVGAAADFLGRLPDLDLPLRGAVVADIMLLAEERQDGGAYACLELEALTITDR